MLEKKLVPLLRFAEFDGEWKENKLSELVNFKSGYAFKSSIMQSEGNFQIIKMSNVYKNKLSLERNPSFINNFDSKSKSSILKKGDNLLTLTGTVGKTDYGYSVSIPKNNKFLLNQRLVRLRGIKNKSNNYFINNILKTNKFLHLFFNEGKGGTGNQSNVGIDDVKNIKLPFPSLPEQQKIASFLTEVDTKLSQLTKKKALLENYKKGVMQQIFPSTGSGQVPEIRFKDGNGNDYSDWEEKQLRDLATYRRGSFPQPYGLPKWYDKKNGTPFVQVYDVDDNMLLKLTTKNKISALGAKQSVFVEKGTLVITIQGSIGKIAKTQYDAYVDRTLLIFQSYKRPLNIDYFKYVLFLLFEIEKMKAPGGIIKTITKEVLSSFHVMIPSLEEQTKIANFLSELDTKIEVLSTSIENTQTFKKGLLQQLFV